MGYNVPRIMTALFPAACLVLLCGVPLARHVSLDERALKAGPLGTFVNGLAELDEPTEDGAAPWAQLNHRLQARMDELERALEDGSWLMATTLPPVQWLQAGWGGAGNEETYIGYQGWLFYRPGFDYVTGPPFLDPDILERRRSGGPSWREPIASDPRPAILHFHRQLRDRGIRLLIVPAPTKLMVHPEGLSPSGDQGGETLSPSGDQGGETLAPSSYGERPDGAPSLHNPSFAEWRRTLEDDGILVFDPTGLLKRLREKQRSYLWTDSHWSPAAVDAVARQLANRVRLLDLPFTGPQVEWRRAARDHDGVGDLARTLRLLSWELYPSETARLLPVSDAAGNPWRSDPKAEVLLLGDSFTNVFSVTDASLRWGRHAGLAEQLSFHLGRAVDRLAVNDGGAVNSRRRLARQPERLDGKKLVIWEFAVRELAMGDWQLVELAPISTTF